MDFNYKKILLLNAENSGTLGRLILDLLVNTPKPLNLLVIKVYLKEILKEFQIP